MTTIKTLRGDLLSKLDKTNLRYGVSRSTFEQSLELQELGVKNKALVKVRREYLHLCVLPETVPIAERSNYSVREAIDSTGHSYEVLVEETKVFEQTTHKRAWNMGDSQMPSAEWLFDNPTVLAEYILVKELKSVENYSETELAHMFEVLGLPAVDGKGEFMNRAEHMASVLINLLTQAPLEHPKPLVIQFNGEKADYSSPEYLRRVENMKRNIEELNSHRKPRRCTGCTNCKCHTKVYAGKGN